MKHLDPLIARWLEEALEHEGRLSLATLLERAVPIETLRELARRHDVALKGYRIERAPAKRLVTALTDMRRPEVVEAVCAALVEGVADRSERPPSKPTGDAEDVAALVRKLKLRETELETARSQVQRLREQSARHRDREAESQRRLDQEAERGARFRAEAEALRRQVDATTPNSAGGRVRDDRRVRELERELDAVMEADDGLRRLLALRQARMRELEETIAELEALVPKGKRKKQPKPEAPALSDTFRLPHFQPSFYKSLEGKERRSIEKALQAALLFCTEGPAYPGLETKPLEGQDLWSIRASLKLRVYLPVARRRRRRLRDARRS